MKTRGKWLYRLRLKEEARYETHNTIFDFRFAIFDCIRLPRTPRVRGGQPENRKSRIANLKCSWVLSLESCVLGLIMIALFGCAGPRVVMKPEDVHTFIDNARHSVTLAQEAGAYELAPEQIARAESLLARAEEAAKEEKRGAEAIRLASEAKEKAEVAYAISRQEKAHERELQRKEREIAELESARKAAKESEEEKAREVQLYERKLRQAEIEKGVELADARIALDSAQERADRVRREKEQELASAMSELEATKEELAKALEEVQAYSEKIEQIEAEKTEGFAAASAALDAAKNNARRAEARLKACSERVAVMEREREKEIAIHVAREETVREKSAELEAEERLFQGKASLETLEKVRKALEGWRIAWHRKDTDRYMSYYADDAKIRKVVIAHGKEIVQKLTKSQMREGMGEIFAQNMQFKMDGPILDAGSEVVRATFEFFKEVPAGVYEEGKEVIRHDKWIKKLLFREVAGEWKIVDEDWRLYQDIPEYAERR